MGHYKNGSRATNAVTYFSVGYTNEKVWNGTALDPLHNEITLGFVGWATEPNRIHLGYWYNDTMHQHIREIQKHPDPYKTFNIFSIRWAPESITWKVNGKVVWTDHGVRDKTMPYRPLSTRFILRPRRDIIDDDVYANFKYFYYTPLHN